MVDTLIKIKRAIIEHRYFFSQKAKDEMLGNGLDEMSVVESIINSDIIYKSMRSRSPIRKYSYERLYVIIGLSYDGLEIYTKGKFTKMINGEIYYHFISSKKSG